MTALLAMLPAAMGGTTAAAATAGAAGTLGMSGLAAGLSSLGASAATTGALTSMGTAAATSLMGGTALSLSSLFSGGLTLASAGMQLMSGFQQSQGILEQSKADARALELQSNDQILAAKNEELRGKQDANDILDTLNKTLASQRLGFSQNGVDPLSGTASAVAKNTSKTANLSLGTSRMDATMRSITRRRQAQEMLIQRGNVLRRGVSDSGAAKLSGFGTSASTITDLYTRRINRG